MKSLWRGINETSFLGPSWEQPQISATIFLPSSLSCDVQSCSLFSPFISADLLVKISLSDESFGALTYREDEDAGWGELPFLIVVCLLRTVHIHVRMKFCLFYHPSLHFYWYQLFHISVWRWWLPSGVGSVRSLTALSVRHQMAWESAEHTTRVPSLQTSLAIQTIVPARQTVTWKLLWL